MVSSNNKIVSSRFFEQSQFEQMIMTHKLPEKKLEQIIVEGNYFYSLNGKYSLEK